MSFDLWTNVGPIRDLADIEALETIPLDQRFDSWDINEWVRRGCRIDPTKRAISFFAGGDPRVAPVIQTYGELSANIMQTANLLYALGVRKDDVVLFLLPNIPSAHVVALAAMSCGIACPVNWMLKPESIVDLVRSSRAKIMIGLGPTPGFHIWETLGNVSRNVPEDIKLLSVQGPNGPVLDSDLTQLAYQQPSDHFIFENGRGQHDVVAYVHSGGTTGAPKLVQLTSGAMVHKCWAVTVTMAHDTSDVIFSDMPIFHIAGFLSCVVLPTALGSHVVIPSIYGARDKTFVNNYWRFVESMRITFMHAVPATLSLLAQNGPQGEDISSLRDYSTTGSTSLPIEVARVIEQKLGIRVIATYGATEFTQNVTQAPRNGDPRYGSTGIRLPDVQIKIAQIDDRGDVIRECSANEIGCVLVKSPGTTPGYVDPRHNEGVLLDDGWINNGDLGRLDKDGYLWITGRAKDLIIRSGHNIDPTTIEEALYAHEAVFMAAAVGRPDAYAGELPIAFVQLREGVTISESELKEFASRRISDPVAAPRDVYIVPNMLLTDVHKIDKVALRRVATQRALSEALKTALPEDASVDIAVMADPLHGTRVCIVVSGSLDQASMKGKVDEVMGAFTIAYDVVLLN